MLGAPRAPVQADRNSALQLCLRREQLTNGFIFHCRNRGLYLVFNFVP